MEKDITRKKIPTLRTLSGKEKFCLDAYVSNGDVDMAWRLSRERQTNCEKPDIQHRMALRWMRDKAVIKYIEERRKILLSDAEIPVSEEIGDFRDKDYIIAQYARLIQSTSDPKTRSELLWRLSELQNMRKKEVDEERRQLTHYYLPLTCFNCSLYKKYQESVKEGENGQISDSSPE